LETALRRADGTFVFNGNWAINWSGEYQAAGATFTYRRQDASTPELISTRGPLTEPIDIMVMTHLLHQFSLAADGFRLLIHSK
jgi:ADAM-TS Spacer 1